jgi:hypothetical protein
MALTDAHPGQGGQTHRIAKKRYVLMLLAKQKAKQEAKQEKEREIQNGTKL